MEAAKIVQALDLYTFPTPFTVSAQDLDQAG